MAAKLNEAQEAQVSAIASSIVALENSDGWKHYKRAVEALIENYTPQPTMITDDAHREQVASQLCFVSGLKRAIGLMDQQKKILSSLQEKTLRRQEKKK